MTRRGARLTRYGSRVRHNSFSKGEGGKKAARAWANSVLASYSKTIRQRRLSRVWWTDRTQTWDAGIYIKEN